MKLASDISLLFLRPFLQYMRNPMFIVVNLATPVLYLLLFMPLLKNVSGPSFDSGDVVQLFIPGIVALLFVMTGISSVYPIIFELKKGLIERLRVTPASRFALLMGPILMWDIWTLVSSALLIALSTLFGFHINAGGLLLFAVLLVLLLTIFAAFGTALAILLKGDITSISGIMSGLNLPLMLLAGVMLPLSLAPSWIRVLAHFDPLYYVVEAGRELAAGGASFQVTGMAFAIIVPLTLLVLWWATRVYRKAVA